MTASPVSSSPVSGSRRELGTAVLLCLLGAVLVLAAGSAGWLVARTVPAAPLPTTTTRLTGAALVPVSALGLLALAGVVALLAAKRFGRTLVGLILALAGVAVTGLTLDVLAHPRAHITLPGARVSTTLAPWPCALGGLLIALAGLLVIARGRRWAALSARYDSPAVRQEQAAPTAAPDQGEAPLAERALWEALDKGDDPTR